MTCSVIKLPGGGTAIVGHSPTRPPNCKFCKQHPATQLCDFEVAETLGGDPMTCDAKMCVQCARRVGEKDFCPNHSG